MTRHRLGLSLVSVLLLAALACFAETKAQPTAPRGAAPSVTFRHGLLTVEANGQTLGDVLAEIKKKSGIAFTMRQTPPNDGVTVSFRDVPIETAIRRLVARDFDLVWFYAPPKSGQGAPVPIEVWVVGRGERAGSVAADQDAATALPPLIAALRDADRKVRTAAAEALGEADDGGDAIAPLGKVLAQDGDSDVRTAAAEAMGEIGRSEAVPLLRIGLRDANSEVRKAVVDALGNIGGPEAERLLRQALTDKDEGVREAASKALAKLEQKER